MSCRWFIRKGKGIKKWVEWINGSRLLTFYVQELSGFSALLLAHGIGQAAAMDLNKEQSGYTARILQERHREHRAFVLLSSSTMDSCWTFA